MRKFKDVIAAHREAAGIISAALVTLAVGFASYGIIYAVDRPGKKPAVQAEAQTGAAESQGVIIAPETQSAPAESQAVPAESQSVPAESQSAPAQSTPTETTAAPSGGSETQYAVGDTINEYGVYFTIVDEQVTAKIETNLRRVPSTEKDEDVVTKIYNGDWIKRTGIGHNGWSRVEYNGQVLYAVTSYLSSDGSSSSEVVYTENKDQVTAKDEVYLRNSPESASDENIAATLKKGETVQRVGIGSNGWSKINYNGVEVYAVTSLLEVVPQQ